MKQTFYSNGKLLLTGEYVVLDGAKALALPTKFGQDLVVETGAGSKIDWKSFDSDGSIWFEGNISFEEIINKTIGNEPSVRNTLIELIHHGYLLNPDFIKISQGYKVETHLTFPKFWGLGTSSTLINNIAQWLGIDAYKLLNNSFGGSGYDIACAQNNSPIIYRLSDGKPLVEKIDFNPAFSQNLYFVYLNRKQSSKAAIASYYKNSVSDLAKKITAIDRITDVVSVTDNPGIFARELEKHETILSDILEMQTVKESFFSDFSGVVKSLGGWGGDFVLAMSRENPTEYFKQRGFGTVLPYSEMIL